MGETTRVLTSVTAAVVLAVGGLAGCSGSDDPGTSSAASPSTSSAAASPSPAVSVALPPGMEWATAAVSGLRFAVPDTWEPMNAEYLNSAAGKAAVSKLLDTMGVTEEQYLESLKQVELNVLGPVEGGHVPVIAVLPNGLSELPAADTLAAELESIGATMGVPSDETTPLGPALLVPYSLNTGGLTIAGRAIVVGGPNRFVTITVGHTNEKAADAVAATLLSTLSAT